MHDQASTVVRERGSISLRSICGYGLLSAVFGARLFLHPLALGSYDWDLHAFYYAETIKSVVEYGQAPFWSPWYCGGNALWQNPQVALLSPVYLLIGIMPLAVAIKVAIVIHVWLAMVGMHSILTRVVGLTFGPGIAYAAALFAFSGAGALHVAVGHSNFLTQFYLPSLFYFAFRAIETGSLRACCAAAAMLALTIVNGGLHMMPIVVLGLAVIAAGAAWPGRTIRPLAITAAIGLIGLLYAAPKLGPVLSLVGSHQFWDTRTMVPHPDQMTLSMLMASFLDASQSVTSKMSSVQQAGWWEYGNYIGELGLLLIVASMVVNLVRPLQQARWVRPIAAAALLFLVLTAGEFGGYAPATWLGKVPGFSLFRLNSRYTIGFVLFGAMAMAQASRGLAARLRWTSTLHVTLTLVCIAAIAQLTIVNGRVLASTFDVAPLSAGFSVGGGTSMVPQEAQPDPTAAGSPMLRAIMANRTMLNCYEPLQLTHRAQDGRPLVWTTPPAEILGVTFTPNRVQFGALVPTDRAARIYFNQNFLDGWTSSAGPVLLEPGVNGPAYVELAPGQTGRFTLAFYPPSLTLSIVVFACACAFTVIALRQFP
jgi:hypothetical protein